MDHCVGLLAKQVFIAFSTGRPGQGGGRWCRQEKQDNSYAHLGLAYCQESLVSFQETWGRNSPSALSPANGPECPAGQAFTSTSRSPSATSAGVVHWPMSRRPFAGISDDAWHFLLNIPEAGQESGRGSSWKRILMSRSYNFRVRNSASRCAEQTPCRKEEFAGIRKPPRRGILSQSAWIGSPIPAFPLGRDVAVFPSVLLTLAAGRGDADTDAKKGPPSSSFLRRATGPDHADACCFSDEIVHIMRRFFMD
jgi:hypothetical protein